MNHLNWQGWAVLSAIFAAMTAILAKIGVDELPAPFATLVRTGVILIIVAGMWAAQGAPIGNLVGAPRTAVALVGSGAATGLSWLCYFQALKMGEASRVAPLDKLSVVLVAVFAALFLGERLDVRGWAGVGLIAGGALLVAMRR